MQWLLLLNLSNDTGCSCGLQKECLCVFLMLIILNGIALWNEQTGMTTFKYGWQKSLHSREDEWWMTNTVHLSTNLLIFYFNCVVFWPVARYYQLLRKGFTMVWKPKHSYTVEERREVHHNLFCLATDLSMLKLFETFLESVPQLLLQLYIVLGYGESSVLQCKYRKYTKIEALGF